MSGANIVFSDMFEQECKVKFGIQETTVQRAVARPDSQDFIELDGLVLGFFTKREGQHKGATSILVCAQKKDDKWSVQQAFRILPELVDSIGTTEPIMLLQGLAQRFGLTIRIGHQLSKFVFREKIPIQDEDGDPSKLVEIMNPSSHSFMQSMYLRIEQGKQSGTKVANVALAYCIDVDKYSAWLLGKELKERKTECDVLVELSPQIRGIVTPRDLITPSGTMEFQSDYSQIGGDNTGSLFRLSSKAYHLEVGFTETHFYIKRNDQKLEWLVKPVYKPTGRVHCFAMWSPTHLSLLILDEAYEESVSRISDPEARAAEVGRRLKILETPATIPPNSLLTWARRGAIAPETAYRSTQRFYEVVVSSILSIQDKVSAIGLHNPFWDITYDGPRIAAREPKHETDIHPTIHGLLFDVAIAKNFLITPEYPIAGGRLDFLITGTLHTGEMVNTCMEFKHAHSDDLLNGLLKQLPAYMQAKGCDFGVYCVMFFKGRYFLEPREHNLQELKFALHTQATEAGLHNIRIVVLDLSHQTPPSKL